MSGRGSALTASREHSSATLIEIQQALQAGDRFILVTGKVGAGKSALCRTLAANSDVLTFVSTVTGPCRSAEELLAQVLGDFGVVGADRPGRTTAPDRHQLLIALQRFLSSLASLGGRALLIVDEAHYLLPAVLRQIGQWVDLDPQGRLQVVLAGHPVLEEILGRPELADLQRKVAHHCALPDPAETALAVQPVVDSPQQPVMVEAEFWRVRVAPESGPLAALRRRTPKLVSGWTEAAPVAPYVPTSLEPVDSAIPVTARQRAWAMVPWRRYRSGIVLGALALAAASWAWQARSGPDAQVAAVEQENQGGSERAAAAPEARAMLPTSDSVSVNIALFRSQQRANAVAAQLVEAGFPAFTRSDSEGFWHQVIVGPYVSAEEALAAQAALKEHGVSGTELRVQNLMAGEVGR